MSLDDAFGDLRALLSEDERSEEWFESLSALIESADESDSETYREVWIPYLSSFEITWTYPLWRCDSLEMLEQCYALAPFAMFELDFRGFDSHDIMELARNPVLGRVMILFLESYHALTDDVMNTLASSPYLKQLETLGLDYADISSAGFEILMKSGALPKLSSLSLDNLANAKWGMEGWVADIQHIEHLPALERLELTSCQLDELDATILTHLNCLDKLIDVNLAYNSFGDEGVLTLIQSKNFSNLKTIDFSECGITDMGMLQFEELWSLPSVEECWLLDNEIDESSIESILSSDKLSHVTFHISEGEDDEWD